MSSPQLARQLLGRAVFPAGIAEFEIDENPEGFVNSETAAGCFQKSYHTSRHNSVSSGGDLPPWSGRNLRR
jgi:hypothetical protein